MLRDFFGKNKKILRKIRSSAKHPQLFVIIANILVLLAIIFVLVRSHNDPNTVYSAKNPEIQNAARNLAADCSSQNKETCYETKFKSLINDHNFSYAEQTLFALQDIDPQTKSCHILSHFISRNAVRKNPSDWLTLMDTVDVNACGSGFLHGVLESHLGDDPDTEFNAALSEEMCNRGTDDYRKRMCTHFMGHFFVINAKDDIEKAIPYCDGVADDLKFDCLDGVFMEHNQKIVLADHGIAELPDYTPAYAKSLEDVCKTQTGIQASACYTELAEIYAKTFGYNAETLHSHCYASGGKKYAENCYGKGQTVLSTYPLDLSAKDLTDICKFYEEEGGYRGCVYNVLASLMYYSPKYTERGLLFCQNIRDYKDWCVTELGNKLSAMVPDPLERQSFCESAESEKYKNLCAQTDRTN